MTKAKNLFKEAQNLLISLGGGEEVKCFANIVFNWQKVFDGEIALYSKPGKIKTGRKGKVLEIKVCNNSVGTELYYRKQEIISKIKDLLGQDIIKDIVLSVNKEDFKRVNNNKTVTCGNVENNMYTEQIKEQELKNSLNSLYNAIKNHE